MKQLQVLVLGVGGNVSQGIIAALRYSNINRRIVGACVSEESLGLYMCDAAYVSPYANEDSFIDWLIEICKKESIDIIFSGVENVIYAIESKREYFESKTESVFICSDVEKLELGNDKLRTVEWLKSNGLNYPNYATSEDEHALSLLIAKCGFPLLAKPRIGKGSEGIYKVNSLEELKSLSLKDYVIQEYLGDESQEYTVACYVDKKQKLHDLIIMHRDLKYGTTFKAEIVDNESIREECVRICEKFKPQGPLNIQLRLHNGKPICFELNVRFSGTVSIRARWGFNDVEAMLREYILNESIHNTLIPHKEGIVYRYFNEYYIDKTMYDTLKTKKIVGDCTLFNNFQEERK